MMEIEFTTFIMALVSPVLGTCLAIAILSIPKFIETTFTGRIEPWA